MRVLARENVLIEIVWEGAAFLEHLLALLLNLLVVALDIAYKGID